MAVVCWLGFTRAGQRLVGRLVARVGGWWWVRVLVGVALVLLAGRLATLPFAAVSYRRRVSYGLSTQAWPDWLSDVALSWAVNVVGTAIVAPGRGRHRASVADLVAGGRRGAGGGVGDARLVRLPGPGGAVVQQLRAAAGRPPARRGAAAGGGRRGAASTTSSWPTRHAVRRPSTPTCRASGAPAAWCSTTTWSAACHATRRCRWWPTSCPTRVTTTCSTARCSGRPAR